MALRVAPYLCDHSAFDSYILLVEGGGQSLLYTGDLRGHGRKSYGALLQQLPEQVDFLVCEGTNLSRPVQNIWDEKTLESRAADWMKRCRGPVFVMQAATNLDRLVSFYRAAVRSGRIFLGDLYQAEVACAAGPRIPQPGRFSNVRVILPARVPAEDPRYQRFCAYGTARIRREQVPANSVICIRPSMQRWVERLAQRLQLTDSVLFYSLWSGYWDKPEMAGFLSRCRELRINEVTLHSSGHATPEEIQRLLERVHPKTIIPVHTLCSDWFAEETLAIAVCCALKYENDFDRALIAAVNHSGDSDSAGAVTGNLLGARLGLAGIPSKYLENLELKSVILELADDLHHGVLSSYGTQFPPPVHLFLSLSECTVSAYSTPHCG